VACEALVYPGLKAAARHWKRRLHALAMDGEGILPSAFEQACRAGLRLAVFSPTLHNPTTATMSLARRMALVALARKWDVVIVEEDVYGLLGEDPPPALAALAPERVIYLTGLSKTVAPGLRLGYLVFPERLRARRQDAEHHTSWYVAPLSMAVATRWMDDGTAWRRLLAQRKELAARHRLCRELLRNFSWRGDPHCPHLWLETPPGGSDAFAQRASAAGVVVVPAGVFASGRLAADGVRVSLGAATDRAALADGLGRLAAL
jgi:DNA-binding transcriptional MocR family regulator